MKVLMLAPEPFFQPRGTPISVHFRIKALSDLGHQTDLITYPLGQDIPFPGFRIRRVPNVLGLRAIKIGPSLPKIPLDGLMALSAFGALARGGYDLVYSHEEAAFFGIVLARLFGKPHLYDMHSSLPQQLTNFQFSTSPLLKSVFTGLEDAVLKSSGSVIVICRDLYDYVAGKGFAEKAVFLENFMDFNDFEEHPAAPETIAAIRRETAPGGEKIILYAGNFEPYQGIPLLVEAMARVQGRAVLLIVGGSKAEHEAAEIRARALGAGGRIRYIEKVPPREVPRYVSAADVLVSPRVSGTMAFTQASCSTIMPQKKAKTVPGAKAVTMRGKNVVSRAANSQWVKLPRAWPSARWRLGKISAMKTQMTVPWPTAWAAMKAKMQAGTMA